MRSILELGDIRGKRVLTRVDWSAPIRDGEILDDYQIRQSFSTIEYLQKAGAKVILLSHAEKDKDSLLPVFNYVKNLLPVTFIKPSNLVLLENVRRNKGEKENSIAYAKKLSKLGDIFVNEAFSVSHRRHASVVSIPKFLPSCIGLQFAREIKELSRVFYPKQPFLFILGGAKFETKLPLLKKFIDIADEIFIGGALANNFLKIKGVDVGDSLIDSSEFGLSDLLETNKLILPEDTVMINNKIMDIGPVTMENLKSKISAAKLILWNGPLGFYELGYKTATLQLAKMIAELGHESIVGGGDTLAVIRELNIIDKYSFVSTGGGAMLDFLATGTLPGIEALSKQ